MKQATLFESSTGLRSRVVNVASVPQRSPFRYPGGKTWFIPRLREWLRRQKKPDLLVEPFAGGGIVSLTSVCEDLVKSALMVELDREIAAVWETAVSREAGWLADKILKFEMNIDNATDEINRRADSIRDIAFKTIIKNRCFHGGILATGAGFLKKGESGKGILSRWYPETLARRFRDIALIADRLKFRQADAFEVLDEYRDKKNIVFFIDPPYTAGGKKAGRRLYTHYEVDHNALFRKCVGLRGDFIMTYDNAIEVRELAKKYHLQAKPVPMKNTHHAEMTELVIGRDLDWMEGINRVLEEQAVYNTEVKTNGTREYLDG